MPLARSCADILARTPSRSSSSKWGLQDQQWRWGFAKTGLAAAGGTNAPVDDVAPQIEHVGDVPVQAGGGQQDTLRDEAQGRWTGGRPASWRSTTCNGYTFCQPHLLVDVEVVGVGDDVGGSRHAACPQLHLLGLLPVVHGAAAHPAQKQTNSQDDIHCLWWKFNQFQLIDQLIDWLLRTCTTPKAISSPAAHPSVKWKQPVWKAISQKNRWDTRTQVFTNLVEDLKPQATHLWTWFRIRFRVQTVQNSLC